MLKVMRESFHHLKWVLLAVVAAFIFGFVFIDMGLGGGGFSGATDESRTFAARVNGETITYNDYYRASKNIEDMYRQMYGQQFTPEMAVAMGLPQQVLDSLIDQRLLLQEARRLKLGATQEEIRSKLLSIPTFMQDGKFVGMELYTRYVTGPLGYPTAAAFEEDLGRDIALTKMDSALSSSVVISAAAAEAEYRRATENAKIRYVLLSGAAASTPVTPAAVEAYYKANLGKYAHGEQRQVRYLLADFAKIRTLANPSDAELQQAYEANREKYKTPGAARVLHILVKVDPNAPPAADAAARAKAESLVQQLRGGADFAALARANSEDPSSAGNGGDMGFVEMGQTVEPFEKAIFSLPLSSVSDPIRTKEYGYHIVKVTERRQEAFRPFADVKPELAAKVANDRSRDIARVEMNRVAATLKQSKPKNVEAFVALANDKVTSNDSGWFGRSEPLAGIGAHQPLTQWVFSAKPGDFSEPIGTSRGIVVAYVTGTRPAGTTALDEVRQQVEQDLRLQKGRDAAKSSLAQAMGGAATIDQVAQKTGQQVAEATVTRTGSLPGVTGDISSLVDEALKGSVGSMVGPVLVGNGAIAFQVVEQKKVTPQELEANRTQYIDTLRGQQVRNLRTVLVKRLRQAADIEVNDEITRPTTAPPPAGV